MFLPMFLKHRRLRNIDKSLAMLQNFFSGDFGNKLSYIICLKLIFSCNNGIRRCIFFEASVIETGWLCPKTFFFNIPDDNMS
jgi:hypothetical protein